jgi:hypothetical protein
MSLPNSYTQLGYIQSSGAQYIDTGVCANPHFSIEVSFVITEKKSTWDTIFGARNGSKSRYTARFKNTSGGTLGVQYSSTGAGTAKIVETSLTKNDFYGDFRTLKFEKNVVYVDGVSTYTFAVPSDNASYPYPLYLFANNDAGTAGDFGYFRVEYCKIWNDTELVRDFVPAKNSEGAVGLYDLVGGVFYTNQGTGEFAALELPKGYTLLRYLRSSGAQYINTGYCPTANTSVVADVYIYNNTDVTYIYGSKGNNCDFDCMIKSNSCAQISYGNKYDTSGIVDNGRSTITHNGATAQFGTKQMSISDAAFDGVSPYPMYIFSHNNAGVAAACATICVYSFKIYDGENLVRDFVPVRNNNGVFGLYDLVGGAFYANQGTGLFMSNVDDVRKAVPSHEYTKLEYIQSDGVQYIDSNFYPTAHTRVMADVGIPSAVQTLIYGSAGNSLDFYCGINTSGYWQMRYGNDGVTIVTASKCQTKIDHAGSYVTLNYPTVPATYTWRCTGASFSGISPYPMYLFGSNNAGVPSYLSTFTFYSLRIYDEGVLVRWFIPVRRKSDNEIGLYDTVNGVFYANQGTGAFIAGADLPDDEWTEPEEPERPALVIGGDIRITEGMTIRGGVLHRIVLS